MQPRLDLHRFLLDELIEHALEVYPRECCGFIAGKGHSASRIIRLVNVASNPHHAFDVAPAELLHTFREIEERGEVLLAIYHSHPRSPAILSEYDIAHMLRHYPQLPQLIIGLRPIMSIKAWLMNHDQPQQVQLIIREDATLMGRSRLNSAQVGVVLLAVLLSLLIFFTISLSLLPPAPPIPTPAG